MKRFGDRSEPGASLRTPGVRLREGRLLEFVARRRATSVNQPPSVVRRAVFGGARQTPRERFLRAIEMEQRGFLDGSVAHLRNLHREVEIASDPCLAISIRYFLGTFLMLLGEVEEARELAEDGIVLAWEHGASEELELLESLSRQLETQSLAP